MNSVCVCEIDVIFPHFIQTHFDWWAMYLFECVALYDPSATSWIRDIPNKCDLEQTFGHRAQVKIGARLISRFVWLKRTVGGWFTYVKNSFWVAKKVKIPVLFLQRDVCLDFSHTLSKRPTHTCDECRQKVEAQTSTVEMLSSNPQWCRSYLTENPLMLFMKTNITPSQVRIWIVRSRRWSGSPCWRKFHKCCHIRIADSCWK